MALRFISRLAGLVMLLTLLLLVIRGQLFSRSPVVILAQLLALVVLVSARFRFASGQFRVTAPPGEGPLLTAGPYRYVRHPMYAGALLLLWASVMGHWTWANGFLALIVSGGVAVRIWDEERELRQHFRGYEEYSRRTKRLVPGLF